MPACGFRKHKAVAATFERVIYAWDEFDGCGGEHNCKRLILAVVVVEVSFDFDCECFDDDDDVDVEEIVFVCSWYKCCIRLRCNSSWVNEDWDSIGVLHFDAFCVRLEERKEINLFFSFHVHFLTVCICNKRQCSQKI